MLKANKAMVARVMERSIMLKGKAEVSREIATELCA